MKYDTTKEWCMAVAQLEEGCEVGAGAIAFDHTPDAKSQSDNTLIEATQIAFGRVVQLLRRQHQWSMEKLAAQARVELSEIVAIENDSTHRAAARTVSQLAHTFSVEPKAFQQLAGNSLVRDSRLREEATRFAARAGSIDRLTSEEARALEEFVTVLGKFTDKTGKPAS